MAPQTQMMPHQQLPHGAEEHYNHDYSPCSPYEDAFGTALETALAITEKSRVIDKAMFDKLPRLDLAELVIGEYLGSGAFSDVYAIGLENSNRIERDDASDNFSEGGSTHSTQSTEISRDNPLLYAIKSLRPEILEDDEQFQCGIADLVIEMHLLSCLTHENIISIRGISSAWFSRDDVICDSSFFFIMDRMDDTLNDKISSMEEEVKRGRKSSEFLADRLMIGHELASAMQFLHKKGIVYRDLKPANIGFSNGRVKLFDFGLARELPKDDELRCEGAAYQMTGMVGSPRYMAPEVARYSAYNHLSDVYSFGILLWEISALKKPFSDFGFKTIEKFQKAVVNSGVRPKVTKDMSVSLYGIMKRCWAPDFQDRPGFGEVMRLLNQETINCRCPDNTVDVTARRRSFLMRKKLSQPKPDRRKSCEDIPTCPEEVQIDTPSPAVDKKTSKVGRTLKNLKKPNVRGMMRRSNYC